MERSVESGVERRNRTERMKGAQTEEMREDSIDGKTRRAFDNWVTVVVMVIIIMLF